MIRITHNAMVEETRTSIEPASMTEEQQPMNDSERLQLELQSAKEEIERLARELAEEKKRNAAVVQKAEETDEFTDELEEDDSSVEESEDESSDEEAEEEAEVPDSPSDADDIRLRAERTLIWANSAIKRSSISQSEEGGCIVPSTVHIPETGSPSSRFGDDNESLLSFDSKKQGPLASIRHFVHEAVEDVKETVADVKDFVADARSPEQQPVVSPSFKYCNAAFKKLGGDDASSTFQESSSSSETRSCEDGNIENEICSISEPSRPAVRCNAAMLKLTQKKQKGPGFLMNRFFKN